jgi:hypothetical protein
LLSTTVFETAPFVHSGTSPVERLDYTKEKDSLAILQTDKTSTRHSIAERTFFFLHPHLDPGFTASVIGIFGQQAFQRVKSVCERLRFIET